MTRGSKRGHRLRCCDCHRWFMAHGPQKRCLDCGSRSVPELSQRLYHLRVSTVLADTNASDARAVEAAHGVPPETTFDAFSRAEMRAAMWLLLKKLTAKQQRVLVWRFGLFDGDDYTLEEVAQKLGVTRERVRQIEAKALRLLRHPSRSKWIRTFVDPRADFRQRSELDVIDTRCAPAVARLALAKERTWQAWTRAAA